jgi:hypothetical protein
LQGHLAFVGLFFLELVFVLSVLPFSALSSDSDNDVASGEMAALLRREA